MKASCWDPCRPSGYLNLLERRYGGPVAASVSAPTAVTLDSDPSSSLPYDPSEDFPPQQPHVVTCSKAPAAGDGVNKIVHDGAASIPIAAAPSGSSALAPYGTGGTAPSSLIERGFMAASSPPGAPPAMSTFVAFPKGPSRALTPRSRWSEKWGSAHDIAKQGPFQASAGCLENSPSRNQSYKGLLGHCASEGMLQLGAADCGQGNMRSAASTAHGSIKSNGVCGQGLGGRSYHDGNVARQMDRLMAAQQMQSPATLLPLRLRARTQGSPPRTPPELGMASPKTASKGEQQQMLCRLGLQSMGLADQELYDQHGYQEGLPVWQLASAEDYGVAVARSSGFHQARGVGVQAQDGAGLEHTREGSGADDGTATPTRDGMYTPGGHRRKRWELPVPADIDRSPSLGLRMQGLAVTASDSHDLSNNSADHSTDEGPALVPAAAAGLGSPLESCIDPQALQTPAACLPGAAYAPASVYVTPGDLLTGSSSSSYTSAGSSPQVTPIPWATPLGEVGEEVFCTPEDGRGAATLESEGTAAVAVQQDEGDAARGLCLAAAHGRMWDMSKTIPKQQHYPHQQLALVEVEALFASPLPQEKDNHGPMVASYTLQATLPCANSLPHVSTRSSLFESSSAEIAGVIHPATALALAPMSQQIPNQGAAQGRSQQQQTARGSNGHRGALVISIQRYAPGGVAVAQQVQQVYQMAEEDLGQLCWELEPAGAAEGAGGRAGHCREAAAQQHKAADGAEALLLASSSTGTQQGGQATGQGGEGDAYWEKGEWEAGTGELSGGLAPLRTDSQLGKLVESSDIGIALSARSGVSQPEVQWNGAATHGTSSLRGKDAAAKGGPAAPAEHGKLWLPEQGSGLGEEDDFASCGSVDLGKEYDASVWNIVSSTTAARAGAGGASGVGDAHQPPDVVSEAVSVASSDAGSGVYAASRVLQAKTAANTTATSKQQQQETSSTQQQGSREIGSMGEGLLMESVCRQQQHANAAGGSVVASSKASAPGTESDSSRQAAMEEGEEVVQPVYAAPSAAAAAISKCEAGDLAVGVPTRCRASAVGLGEVAGLVSSLGPAAAADDEVSSSINCYRELAQLVQLYTGESGETQLLLEQHSREEGSLSIEEQQLRVGGVVEGMKGPTTEGEAGLEQQDVSRSMPAVASCPGTSLYRATGVIAPACRSSVQLQGHSPMSSEVAGAAPSLQLIPAVASRFAAGESGRRPSVQVNCSTSSAKGVDMFMPLRSGLKSPLSHKQLSRVGLAGVRQSPQSCSEGTTCSARASAGVDDVRKNLQSALESSRTAGRNDSIAEFEESLPKGHREVGTAAAAAMGAAAGMPATKTCALAAATATADTLAQAAGSAGSSVEHEAGAAQRMVGVLGGSSNGVYESGAAGVLGSDYSGSVRKTGAKGSGGNYSTLAAGTSQTSEPDEDMGRALAVERSLQLLHRTSASIATLRSATPVAVLPESSPLKEAIAGVMSTIRRQQLIEQQQRMLTEISGKAWGSRGEVGELAGIAPPLLPRVSSSPDEQLSFAGGVPELEALQKHLAEQLELQEQQQQYMQTGACQQLISAISSPAVVAASPSGITARAQTSPATEGSAAGITSAVAISAAAAACQQSKALTIPPASSPGPLSLALQQRKRGAPPVLLALDLLSSSTATGGAGSASAGSSSCPLRSPSSAAKGPLVSVACANRGSVAGSMSRQGFLPPPSPGAAAGVLGHGSNSFHEQVQDEAQQRQVLRYSANSNGSRSKQTYSPGHLMQGSGVRASSSRAAATQPLVASPSTAGLDIGNQQQTQEQQQQQQGAIAAPQSSHFSHAAAALLSSSPAHLTLSSPLKQLARARPGASPAAVTPLTNPSPPPTSIAASNWSPPGDLGSLVRPKSCTSTPPPLGASAAHPASGPAGRLGRHRRVVSDMPELYPCNPLESPLHTALPTSESSIEQLQPPSAAPAAAPLGTPLHCGLQSAAARYRMQKAPISPVGGVAPPPLLHLLNQQPSAAYPGANRDARTPQEGGGGGQRHMGGRGGLMGGCVPQQGPTAVTSGSPSACPSAGRAAAEAIAKYDGSISPRRLARIQAYVNSLLQPTVAAAQSRLIEQQEQQQHGRVQKLHQQHEEAPAAAAAGLPPQHLGDHIEQQVQLQQGNQRPSEHFNGMSPDLSCDRSSNQSQAESPSACRRSTGHPTSFATGCFSEAPLTARSGTSSMGYCAAAVQQLLYAGDINDHHLPQDSPPANVRRSQSDQVQHNCSMQASPCRQQQQAQRKQWWCDKGQQQDQHDSIKQPEQKSPSATCHTTITNSSSSGSVSRIDPAEQPLPGLSSSRGSDGFPCASGSYNSIITRQDATLLTQGALLAPAPRGPLAAGFRTPARKPQQQQQVLQAHPAMGLHHGACMKDSMESTAASKAVQQGQEEGQGQGLLVEVSGPLRGSASGSCGPSLEGSTEQLQVAWLQGSQVGCECGQP